MEPISYGGSFLQRCDVQCSISILAGISLVSTYIITLQGPLQGVNSLIYIRALRATLNKIDRLFNSMSLLISQLYIICNTCLAKSYHVTTCLQDLGVLITELYIKLCVELYIELRVELLQSSAQSFCRTLCRAFIELYIVLLHSFSRAPCTAPLKLYSAELL